MAAITKTEFYNSALEELGNYPALQAAIALRDTTVTQHIGAISQMLAMLSAQISIAETEVWEKTRDNMVIADAVRKGVLPFAEPPAIEMMELGQSGQSTALSVGAKVYSSDGKPWVVTANNGSIATVKQIDEFTYSHTVSSRESFYKIPIDVSSYDGYVVDIRVFSNTHNVLFTENQSLANVAIDDKSYFIDMDDMMNMYITFGVDGLAGHVPNSGDSFSITIRYTNGAIDSSPTDFNSQYTDNELAISRTLGLGANPKSVIELREIAKLPFLYDRNAVYLGEFEMLLSSLPYNFQYLRVWNERDNEEFYEPDFTAINTLFVSFSSDLNSKAQIKEAIKSAVSRADNSYKVRFVDVADYQIPMNIRLRIPSIYDANEVIGRVRKEILSRYGKVSAHSKTGKRINWQRVAVELKDAIYELNDGLSDVSVSVVEDDNSQPHIYRYVSESSLSINNLPIDHVS